MSQDQQDTHYVSSRITVTSECGVWMNNSTFEYEYTPIFTDSTSIGTNIVITNCDFYGRNTSLKPIYISSTGNLNVINCMFFNCAEWGGDLECAVIYFANNG
eukprot:457015_1